MRRYQVGHTTLNTNVLIRAEIHDSLLGVDSDDELVGDGTIQYSHQRLDPSQYTEIQSGELGIGVHIQSNAHRTLRNDILNASEGRFELYLYLDGVFEWKGVILPDLCEFTESFDEVLTLKAKDFTLLKRDLFPLEDKRETIITTVEGILSDFDLPIVTATSWVESNTDADNDFLRQIYHETKALRQFTDPDNDDIQITNEEALRWILRGYGLTLRQSGGALRIDQFTAYEDSESVLLSTYNSGFQSQALTNVRQTSTPITIDSTNKPNVALKRVTNTFNHRTQTALPQLPRNIFLDNDTPFRKETFQVIPDADSIVRLSGSVTATAVGDLGVDEGSGEVGIVLRVGQYYWDGEEWTETLSEFVTSLDFRRNAWFGFLSIETSVIPSDATTPVVVEFTQARLELYQTATTVFATVELEIDVENVSNAVSFRLENGASFTQDLTYPVSYFGDGPFISSPSALRYSLNNTDLTANSWQRRGSTEDNRAMHSNLLHEVLDGRRGFRRVINATIKGTFETHKVLSYDGAFFYYLGGTFDGYTGNWSVQVVQILVQDLDEQIQDIATSGLGGGSGLGSFVNFSLENLRRILLLAGVVGLTTTDYEEEEITEIDLDLNQPLREGFEYWVINSKELSGSNVYEGIYPFMPDIEGTSNSGLVTLPIDEQTMNAPKGSLVILAPSQAATNQTRMESISSATIDGVEINAQAVLDLSTDIGNIENDIDGIDVDLGIIGARAVLFTDVNGNIASITLLSGTTGSAIDIKASQVKINGVLFDDNGMMRSTSFNGSITNGVATTIGTTGWAIDRSGQAIFHNIRIRGGDVTGINLTGNVGAIRVEATLPASGNYTGEALFVSGSPDKLYRWNGTAWISTLDGDDLLVNSVTAGKINVATLSAISASMGTLSVDGTLTVQVGGSIVGDNFTFSKTGGTIAGWIIDSNTLKSQASGRRIELNKASNRVSIFDDVGEKAVMGYLNGLAKNDGVGNWGVANYGFWAKAGDQLVIDGDVTYDSGDWIIENDASYLVNDGSGNTIIRLGTDTGSKGLFLYNTIGTTLAAFVSGGLFIGDDTTSDYMRYTIGGGLVIRGGLNADDIQAGTIATARLDVTDIFAQTVTIGGTLTMGAGSKITNTAGDFEVNNDGFIVKDAGIIVGGALPFGRSYTVVDSANPSSSVVGVFADSSLNGYLAMPRNGKSLTIQAGIIQSPVQDPGADLIIRATRDILINLFRYIAISLPTSNPGGTNRLWNDSGTVKIT